ncbi:hypothetical protein [Lysobacter sp. CFH 32150]|uniref:hypothetical protein n=1 Tax=Lysobacter sp. CFH 32150 TaxID=2927128 RepID=UPI001FA78D5E|nr:hypothetical protein [Lysobacter sp. CFH 32150]MCI4566385.1 hypothetical protein [Lysobacter sp. CFH 32150]
MRTWLAGECVRYAYGKDTVRSAYGGVLSTTAADAAHGLLAGPLDRALRGRHLTREQAAYLLEQLGCVERLIAGHPGTACVRYYIPLSLVRELAS